MHQLYTLKINRRIFWSTSLVEMLSFAKTWKMIGYIEDGGQVPWEHYGVMCIEQ